MDNESTTQGNGGESENTNQEGSVAAELEGKQPEKQAEAEPQTVPLAAYLELKNDVKDLRKDLKDALESKHASTSVNTAVEAGIAELRSKYPDVNEDFIADMVMASTKKAREEIEAKYSPIIERQEAEKQQEKFDRAFEAARVKVVDENPDLPAVDWEAIKALALTPSYIKLPLADVVQKIYGGIINKGKATTENDMRSGADRVNDIVDVKNLTPEQHRKVMEDPKARKAYFDKLDGLPDR